MRDSIELLTEPRYPWNRPQRHDVLFSLSGADLKRNIKLDKRRMPFSITIHNLYGKPSNVASSLNVHRDSDKPRESKSPSCVSRLSVSSWAKPNTVLKSGNILDVAAASVGSVSIACVWSAHSGGMELPDLRSWGAGG